MRISSQATADLNTSSAISKTHHYSDFKQLLSVGNQQ
jgi:hypothetical protein